MELTGLREGTWQSADIDLTTARRPDGSGGPLAADERIDDIQFYIPPDVELLIDDIVLYDGTAGALSGRPLFTGWFDTGAQGKEWPGDFEIVAHDKPLTWDAARSVPEAETGQPWLRIDLRGPRPLGAENAPRFRYRLGGAAGPLRVAIADETGKEIAGHEIAKHAAGEWTEARWDIKGIAPGRQARDIRIHAPKGGELLVDDVLLFETAKSQDGGAEGGK